MSVSEGLDSRGIELAVNDCGSEVVMVASGAEPDGRGMTSLGDGNKSSLSTPSSSKKRGGREV